MQGRSDASNLCTPILGLLIDLDEQTRSSVTPDIGADEFNAASIEVGLSTLSTRIAENTVIVGDTFLSTIVVANDGI